MNDKEILILGAIRDVCEKRIRRKDAARVLSLSVRQVQLLVTRFRQQGAVSIVHQRRGQSSSNRINHSVKLRCLALIREHNADFGPTLAHEKLTERHDIHVSVEMLRQSLSGNCPINPSNLLVIFLTTLAAWLSYRRRTCHSDHTNRPRIQS